MAERPVSRKLEVSEAAGTSGPPGSLEHGVPPAGEIHALLRACHQRRLEREGIPMILGLVDERRPLPPSEDPAALESGAALATVLASYHRTLVPFARPDDEGALIAAMQVVAYSHFAPVSPMRQDSGTAPA